MTIPAEMLDRCAAGSHAECPELAVRGPRRETVFCRCPCHDGTGPSDGNTSACCGAPLSPRGGGRSITRFDCGGCGRTQR